MELTLQRLTGAGSYRTFGELKNAAGDHIAHTLEDMVREVAGEPVRAWKVKGETAIPSGRYKVTLESSARFGPNTLTLNAVPGFEAIRCHGGNTERDTEGCPLLGMNRSEAGINNCAPAVAKVKALVADAINAGEEVWLQVCNFEG